MNEPEKNISALQPFHKSITRKQHIIFVVLLFILGSGAGVLVWYQKTVYENVLKKLENQTILSGTQGSDIERTITFEDCFANYYKDQFISVEEMDTSDWVLFQGTGFDMKHPPEMNIVRGVGRGGDVSYTATMSGQSAEIDIYIIENTIFRIYPLYTPILTYEHYSDTWWKGVLDSYDPANSQRCNPNESAKTASGKFGRFPVYISGAGDAGSSFIEYYIVMRNAAGSSDLLHYGPVVVKFTLSSGGDFSSVRSIGVLGDVVKYMILHTLDVGATSKG